MARAVDIIAAYGIENADALVRAYTRTAFLTAGTPIAQIVYMASAPAVALTASGANWPTTLPGTPA